MVTIPKAMNTTMINAMMRKRMLDLFLLKRSDTVLSAKAITPSSKITDMTR